MNPHPNESLIHRAWQAVADGDVDELRKVISEKAGWTATGQNPWAGRHEGFDAIVNLLARMGEELETFDANIHDVLVSDDRVVVLCRVSATIGEHSLHCDYLVLFNVEHGSIVDCWSCPMNPQAILDFWDRVRQTPSLSAWTH